MKDGPIGRSKSCFERMAVPGKWRVISPSYRNSVTRNAQPVDYCDGSYTAGQRWNDLQ